MQRRKPRDARQADPMMTVAEVSNYLSLSATSVYRLAHDLRALRVNGRWAFRVSDVEQWLLKHRTADETQVQPVEELGSEVVSFLTSMSGTFFSTFPTRRLRR
jgi:excisionase family DNA binding protein